MNEITNIILRRTHHLNSNLSLFQLRTTVPNVPLPITTWNELAAACNSYLCTFIINWYHAYTYMQL